jgi:uncharacterized protein with GYD domain
VTHHRDASLVISKVWSTISFEVERISVSSQPQEDTMPKFLVEANYTAEGAKAVAHEGGTSRRKAVEEMLKGVGGTVEAFYFAFGGTDVFVLVDVPDAVTAMALSIAVNQSGAANLKLRVLMSPEDMDLAAKKSVHYRAPGK